MEVVPGKGARRCLCRKRDVRTELLGAAHIPRRYEECSLSNYQPATNNGSQLRAFNYAYRLVREYPSADRSLLFMGPCGIGKTRLSVAILRELIEKKGVPCLFRLPRSAKLYIDSTMHPMYKPRVILLPSLRPHPDAFAFSHLNLFTG
jgi:DNA replication protein DnaC